MITFTLAFGLGLITGGWLTNTGPLMIGGFFVVLLGLWTSERRIWRRFNEPSDELTDREFWAGLPPLSDGNYAGRRRG